MLVIDPDLRSDFKQCPRKLYWSKLAGLELKNRDEGTIKFPVLIEHVLNKKLFDDLVDLINKDLKKKITDSEKVHIEKFINKLSKALSYLDDKEIFNLKIDQQEKGGEKYNCLPFYDNGDKTVTILHAIYFYNLHMFINPERYLEINEMYLYYLQKFKEENHKLNDKKLIIKQIDVLVVFSDQIKKITMPYDPEMIEKFQNTKEETNHVMRQMCKHVHSIDSWPWNSQNCHDGEEECDYLDLCLGNVKESKAKYKRTKDRSMDNDKQRQRFGIT